jgi:hypothetical protein
MPRKNNTRKKSRAVAVPIIGTVGADGIKLYDKLSTRALKRGLNNFGFQAYKAALGYYSKHYDNPAALTAFTRALDGSNSKPEGAIKIEWFLSNPRLAGKNLAYAIRAVLIELSNESSVNVDDPGIAGAFYAIVAAGAGRTNLHTERLLRHMDVLLGDPDPKSVKAIIKYWDDGRMDAVDPFPG